MSKSKALILVGGYGTRLRPLTFYTPKPCIEFCGRPFIYWMIDALIEHEVSEIIFACCHQTEKIKSILDQYTNFIDNDHNNHNNMNNDKKNVKFTIVHETVPQGTAGAIRNAKQHLLDANYFFVCNSDVICDYNSVMYNLMQINNASANNNDKDKNNHNNSNKMMGSIAGFKVQDPTKYGVLVLKPNSEQIESFIEKPKDDKFGNIINGGFYYFDIGILNFISDQPEFQMLEKDVFPNLAKKGLLGSSLTESFWMDIGQPNDYIKGQYLFLNQGNNQNNNNIYVHNSTKLGDHCYIAQSSIFSKCEIGNGVVIKNSIIGQNCKIQDNVFIENSILGNDVSVLSPNIIYNAKIAPFKEIKTNCISENVKDYM